MLQRCNTSLHTKEEYANDCQVQQPIYDEWQKSSSTCGIILQPEAKPTQINITCKLFVSLPIS